MQYAEQVMETAFQRWAKRAANRPCQNRTPEKIYSAVLADGCELQVILRDREGTVAIFNAVEHCFII